MSFIVDIDASRLAAFGALEGAFSLDDVTLQYEDAINAALGFSGIPSLDTLSPTLIEIGLGTAALRLEGSGFGPVTGETALLAALEANTATGTLTRLSLTEGATTLATLDIGSTELSLTSGTSNLTVTGQFTQSIPDFIGLIGGITTLLDFDDEMLDAAALTDLTSGLSNIGLSGLSFSHEGTLRLTANLTDSALTVAAQGYTLSLTGQFPTDLQDLSAVLAEIAQNSGGTHLDDARLTLIDGANSETEDALIQISPHLETGRKYLAVSGDDSFDTGGYSLFLLSTGTIGSATTQSETTDAADTEATTYTLAANQGITGRIDMTGDTDWFAVDYTQGQTLYGLLLPQSELDNLTTLAISGLTATDPQGQTIMSADLTLGSLLGDGDALFRINGHMFDDIEVVEPSSTSGQSTFFAAASTSGDDLIQGTDGPDSLLGGAGNDSITGLAGNDTLSGGLDNDTVSAGSGNDLVFTGPGMDSLLGDDGDDTLYGAGDDDTLEGGNGADLLGAGPGNDSLVGGAGDDALWTAAGNDEAYGGDGNDTLGGADGDDLLDGGLGNDELWGSLGNDTLSGGPGDDTLGGAAGNDFLNGSSGMDELWGAAGNDSLFGGEDNDLLGGALGDDSLSGGTGVDTLWGAAGFDTLNGGEGDDIIGAGDDDDSVLGSTGNDQLSGGRGNDSIYAADDNDTIFGGAGDDLIVGGEDDDLAYGGAGRDTFVFNQFDGNDTLFAVLAEDMLQLDSDLWTGALTRQEVLTQFGAVSGTDYVLTFDGGETITLSGQGSATQGDLVGFLDIA